MEAKPTQPFIYRWIEISTSKWYLGSRTAKGCHIEDGYICSSKIVKPLILEKPWNWIREIVFIGEDDQCRYIVEMETKILTELDAKNDPMSYNQHNGDGVFSRGGRPQTQVQKDAASKANKGKQKTKAQLESIRKVGLASKGRIATPAQKEASIKNGLANKGRLATPAQREAFSLARKGTVVAFNLETHEIKRIPKAEFESNKDTLYVGNMHRLAKEFRKATNGH